MTKEWKHSLIRDTRSILSFSRCTTNFIRLATESEGRMEWLHNHRYLEKDGIEQEGWISPKIWNHINEFQYRYEWHIIAKEKKKKRFHTRKIGNVCDQITVLSRTRTLQSVWQSRFKDDWHTSNDSSRRFWTSKNSKEELQTESSEINKNRK